MTQNYTRTNEQVHEQQKIKSSRGYYNQTRPQTCKQWSLYLYPIWVFRTSILTIIMVNVKCTHVYKAVKYGPIVGSPRATCAFAWHLIEVLPDFLRLWRVLAHFMTSWPNTVIILQHSTATRDAVRHTLLDVQPKNLLENSKKSGHHFTLIEFYGFESCAPIGSSKSRGPKSAKNYDLCWTLWVCKS